MIMKKAIIIGSGIGGSSIGALLCSIGYKVELFEKNSLLGGRYSTYTKVDDDGREYKMDVGCHLVGNCEKGSIGKVFNEIGLPNAIKWSYASHPRPIFYYINQFIKFPQEIHKIGLNNRDFKSAFKLFDKLKSITDEEIRELEENQVTLSDFLKDYTKNEKIFSLMSFINGMYFVISPDKASASEWIRCQNEIQRNKSSGYPIGGTGIIANTLCKYIEDNGGTVHKETEVSKIIIDNQTAKGVELKNGEQIFSDLIISNAGVINTVNNLIEHSVLDNKYIARINKYEYSLATVQVKVALDKKITDQKMIMFLGEEFDLDSVEERYENMLDEQIPDFHPVLFCPIVSNIDPSVAPEGTQLIYAGGGCPMPNDGFSNKNHKDGWEKACINSLERIFPDIRDHILWIETTTPEDIMNFVDEAGCVIGISQAADQMGANRPDFQVPNISNLYLCCADTGTTGIGGELAANSALNLFDIIKNDI
ncbi:MAG: NAD(P)-binding protein [Candidatus Lokiarchaeota archaeon]|nr:NAD(P)-binding protein [Candidatus Lokiarchaeota archaeon]